MILSPGDPSILMGKAFGDTIRPLQATKVSDQMSTDEEIASLLLTIDEAAENGIAAFDAFVRFDLNWRTLVFQGKIEYDESVERSIGDNFQQWLGNAELFLETIDGLKAFGLEIKSDQRIKDRVTQVRAMLTPDDEFFEGDELDDLAADAIAADDAGRTVEFTVMGE